MWLQGTFFLQVPAMELCI